MYAFERYNKDMCMNMYYVMHMTGGSQKLRQEKHMFCLQKPDTPVW
jgi:hypothetical protein